MKLDKWTKEVAQTFISVITRPRFRSELVSEEFEEKQGNSVYNVIFRQNEQIYSLRFTSQRDSVHIYANTIPESKFRFSQSIPRQNPPGLRKIALIFMKKVSHKPIFDIMHI